MQITEQIIERISRRTFNSMFAPALRQSNVVTGGAGSSVSWADNAGHADTANSASTSGTASAAPWAGITDKPATATRWPKWSEVTEKPDVAIQAAHNNLLASGNEFTFARSGFSGDIWLNYRTAGGLNGAITGYTLGDGAGNALGTIIHSGNNPFMKRGELNDAYVNGTTYSTLNNGTYFHAYTGASETIIHFQRESCSASGLDIRFKYPQDSSNPLQYRKCIDSNRFASTDWVTLIDSLNIGNQSVDYATSAGSATSATKDGDGNTISSTYLKLIGGTLTGNLTVNPANTNDARIGVTNTNASGTSIFLLASTNRGVYHSTAGWLVATNGTDSWLNIGKVGIGTDSPSQKLHVSGGLVAITNNSRTVTIGAQNNGAIHIYNDNSSPFFFNGDVCCNSANTYDLGSTTYPWGSLYAAQCYIYGTTPSVHVGTSSSARISLHWASDSKRGLYDYTDAWVIGTDGTNTFLMKGNVGIGTTSPGDDKLKVNGSICTTVGLYSEGYVDGLAYNTASDKRLKDIIDYDAVPHIDDIANAPAIHFTWKNKRDKKIHVGTIAQYWQKITPECVHQSKRRFLTMNYDVIALVNTIALAREINALKHEIAELKNKAQ
jgi:hypothetical protein